MRAVITSPRVLRTGAPLALTAIRQACPAVFASEAKPDRSARYRYVPTEVPLLAMMDEGWGVYEVSAQKALKRPDQAPFTKHMLRMRRMGDFGPRSSELRSEDGVPELILVNSHDGSSSYLLKAGFYRFICCNGLMVGTTMASYQVKHTIGAKTTQEVLEAGEKVVLEGFPKMLEGIEKFKRIYLSKEVGYKLATDAIKLRYPTGMPPITEQEVLAVRRPEDEDSTLWAMLNRIQENIIDGGWPTISSGHGRRSMVRPVERVSSVVNINTGIWDLANQIAEIV